MNKTCPRCGYSFEPKNTVDQICTQCAFNAVLNTESSSDYSSSRNEADAIVNNLSDLEEVTYISQGGMGVLYRARQNKMDREIAIKVISGHFHDEPEFMERFEREIKTLGSLNHPNIVTIHDSGFSDDVPYFIMEFVDGKSLREKMQEEKLSPSDVLEIVKSVAEALDHAHKNGVVHRDIKPENILIRNDGCVKVVDFGIAQILNEGDWATRLTSSQKMMGSPKYMAPEQIETPNQTDHRVDIYALSVMAYELLTGTLPRGTFPVPSKLVDVDTRMDGLILKGMESDPNQRHESMEEFIEEINSILDEDTKGRHGILPHLSFKQRSKNLWASRLFWAMFVGVIFELLSFFNQVIITYKPDPKFVFEKYANLTGKEFNFYKNEIIQKFGKGFSDDKTNQVLIEAASGTDQKKATAAIKLAFITKRIQHIPAHIRYQVLKKWDRKNKSGQLDQINDEGFMADTIYVQSALAIAIVESGTDLAPVVFHDIISGQIPKDKMHGAAEGLGRIAPPDLLRSMYRYLMDHQESEFFPAVLYAFTLRTGLLSLCKPELTKRVKEVYVKYLPTIFNEKAAKVYWEQANNLLDEVIHIDYLIKKGDEIYINYNNMQTYSNEWLEEYGILDQRLKQGSPPERISKRLSFKWPMDEDTAKNIKEDILNNKKAENVSRKKLLLLWKVDKEFLMPYLTYKKLKYNDNVVDRAFVIKYRQANIDFNSNLSNLPWEIHTVYINSIASPPVLLGSKTGFGNIETIVQGEVTGLQEISDTETSLHFGLKRMMKKKKKNVRGMYKIKINGKFEERMNRFYENTELNHLNKVELYLRRSIKSSFIQNGNARSSSDTLEQICIPGEAGLLELDKINNKIRSFTLLIPEPDKTGSQNLLWKKSIAKALKRISGSSTILNHDYIKLDDLAFLAAYIPIEEAGPSLLKLWERPENKYEYISEETKTYLGAGLLMIGDSKPLDDPLLLKEIPSDIALRIYLFCENEIIRKAVKPRINSPRTRLDSMEIKRYLDERGERETAFAKMISEKVTRFNEQNIYNTDKVFKILSTVIIIILILYFILFFPLPRNRFQWACLFINLGFIFRFITVEWIGIIWFPILSCILFIIASFLYSRFILRSLSFLVLLAGILEMMIPNSSLFYSISVLLFCLYVSIMFLDFISRIYPHRINVFEGFFFIATWWSLIIPMATFHFVQTYFSLFCGESKASMWTMSGNLYSIFLFFMILSPILFVRLSGIHLFKINNKV